MTCAELPVNDLGEQRKLHPLRDEWWQSLVPDLEKIVVPMLICTSFSDSNVHSRGSFRAFEKVSSTDKFAYTHRGGKWATFYSDPARRAQLGFFDRYLKGQDVPKPPQVRLEVRERRDVIAEVRAEQEWPLARTRWRDLSLGPDGTLTETAPTADGSVTFHTRRKAAAFTFPVTGDLEITGPMSLGLHISVQGSSDVGLFVGAEKWRGTEYVPFEGSYGFGRDRVATGWQRACLRELDNAASTTCQPVHTFTHPQPITPGEIVPLEIALGPSSTLFHAGDSLRLLVAGRSLSPRNPLMSGFPASYAPTGPARCTVHWGPGTRTVLRVPVIPRTHLFPVGPTGR
jgi:putative CocE/NonD family hydrolase